jgi:ADP-heptose:LPS heptosyltransferase
MRTIKEMLEIEERDLWEKMLRLGEFIDSKEYDSLSDVQQSLLHAQHAAMNCYRVILKNRIYNL